jgi:hypothetical protein
MKCKLAVKLGGYKAGKLGREKKVKAEAKVEREIKF